MPESTQELPGILSKIWEVYFKQFSILQPADKAATEISSVTSYKKSIVRLLQHLRT